MRKVALFFILICLLSTIASCRHRTDYDFLDLPNLISSVAVVDLSFDSDNRLIVTEVKEIDDIDKFLVDFNNIDCYVYYGDPTGVTPEGIQSLAFKISYNNGKYELINWNGQSTFIPENGLTYYDGFRVFDENQFVDLIEKYR